MGSGPVRGAANEGLCPIRKLRKHSRSLVKNVKRPITTASAILLFLLLDCSIFFAEALSLMFTYALLPISQWGEALFDSTLLLALLFPSSYFFVFRPLNAHIAAIHPDFS